MLDLVQGQQLSSRFFLVQALGKGGMGEVWLAEDRELKERVALKILDAKLAESKGMVNLLRNECRNSRRLVHPNIVRVYDFHGESGLYFISMGYIVGGDIGDRINAPVDDILEVIRPIADALQYAHGLGVIHRDIKVSNILLDEGGTPYLTDFGIASVRRRADGLIIRSGGSPGAMSPQQIAGEAPAASDDIFALGALLYELLSGRKPFPDQQTARANRRTPEPLPASETIPPRLHSLVMSMLAASPQDRPASMEAVNRELEAIVAERAMGAAASSHGSEDDAERILPVEPQLTVARGEAAVEAERPRRPALLGIGLAAGFVLLLVVLVGVVFYLPDVVEDRLRESPPSPPVVQQPSRPQVKPEIERAAPTPPPFSEEDKEAAEDALAELIHKQEYLKEKAVEDWAAEDYAQVVQTAGQGDLLFLNKNYRDAATAYREAITILNTLAERMEKVLNDALDSGKAALLKGRGEEAQAHFELALKIEPDNRVAAKGFARARTIGEVFALIASGRAHEEEDRLREAYEDFRRARDLDPEVTSAQEGMSRVAARIDADRFQQTVSRGFVALGEQEYDAAIKAFEEASKLRPGSAEVLDGLAQAKEGKRLHRIAMLQEEAGALESEEKWHEALKRYQAVLAIDSSLLFAQQGEQRAGARAALSDGLDQFVNDPERLYSPAVHGTARALLEQAMTIQDKGPGLKSQIGRLTELLRIAQTPVPVSLQSDNLTQVVIYKVGRLGSFTSRQLELLPGTYTVVGTRDGYRDVRQSLKIVPGQPFGPVVVRCEEPI